MNFRILSGADALAIRKKLHLNQTDFWGPLNVSQSCGSRYEADAANPGQRSIPGTVQLLVCLKYGNAKQRKAALKYMQMEAM